MGALLNTPHVVQRIRPKSDRNATTNVTDLQYEVPPATMSSLRGFFQVRQGTIAVGSDGSVTSYDALFYTLIPNAIEPNDLLVVTNQGGVTGKYLVKHAAPKASMIGGKMSHVEVYCTKDDRF